ncbi:uncharacterized protein LOC132725128 [Ruditapes philippinarum]|uniref:uncharacterized protein LOC132725128 n=1 Tax=Ruditapes philippinarum TaxID=129788 RepID=UPI00295AE24D|nr:uncharacterized protein LOC132725128 [Ruditapes philippinarum]
MKIHFIFCFRCHCSAYRMEHNTVLTICIFVCLLTHQAYAVCDLQSPFTISEEAPNGTVILNTTKLPGTNASFTIKNPTQGGVGVGLRDRLSLINDNTTFQLINSEVLDLEEFMITYGVDISIIELMVTCGGKIVIILFICYPSKFNAA